MEDSEVYNICWSDAARTNNTPDAVGWAKPQFVNLKSAFDPEKYDTFLLL
jgi:hypothetical protein